MKYTREFNINPYKQQDTERTEYRQKAVEMADKIYDLPRNPTSDVTNFIIKSTTVDRNKISDNKIKSRNEIYLMVTDMFPALSNITESDQALTRYLWQDIMWSLKFGFVNRAWRKGIELIHFYNETRGINNVFSNQLITTREILLAKQRTEEERNKKRNIFGFMKGKPEEETERNMKTELIE